MSKGSGTRSGLLWEVERILTEIRDSNGELPQILFMENVPQVHSQDNMPDFRKWLDFLESLGYTNYYQDLNAKNYGVAQNRERCFMFSFLREYNYHFPQPIPLKKKLKDYLEDNVDEKYYINNEKADKLIKQLIDNGTLPQHNLDRQTCVDKTINKPQQRVSEVGFIDKGTGQHQSNTIYSNNGCCPCLNAANHKEPIKVITKGWLNGSNRKYIHWSNSRFSKRFISDCKCVKAGNHDLGVVLMEQRRLGNLYGDDRETRFAENVWDKNYISPSLTTMQGGERTDDC